MLTTDTLNDLLGMPATKAYGAILMSIENLVDFTVFNYPPPPLLQDRVQQSDFERQIIQDALELRGETGMPFWEAIFNCCLKAGHCSDGFLDGAIFHSGLGVPTRLTRGELVDGSFERLAGESAKNLGLASEIVVASGKRLHFHQLDFHCDVSDANTKIVENVCRRLMPRGFVAVDSGDSYHAMSLEPVTPEERIRTLGKALLYGPIIDCRYIGHQLRQNCSSIRISQGGSANKVPVVVGGTAPDQPVPSGSAAKASQ